ncbi:MAG: glycosyltransferase family 2 protein [Proteobacteria bacterium]|nr:glycosyltransferase family 2 protein [Pseudomonadota bacterium]
MLTVSVVVYNNEKTELQCLIDSVLNSAIKDIKFIIIDNSPTDKLRSLISNYPKIDYIFNNRNLGYGAAHNIAIRKYLDRSKYHLVLNPDIYFKPDVLSSLYEYMEQNNDIGLVMPKVLYKDGAVQYICKLLPTPLTLLFRRFSPFKSLNRRMNYRYELKFTGYNKIMSVPSLSGCFMFIRTDVLKKIGLFDERFFMYLEDVDLSRRIHNKYKTIFYPAVQIYHGHEKGSYKNFNLLKHHLRSAIKYFNKWGWFFDAERKKINKKTIDQKLSSF